MARITLAESFTRAPAVNVAGKPRRVANNTFRYVRADGATVTRLHVTDIVVAHADGTFTVTSGGWRSVTTKDRLNAYLPGYSIYSDRGTWIVRERATGREAAFFDGMTLPADMARGMGARAEADKARKAIRAFVAKVKAGEVLPAPGTGDCWHCSMFGREPPAVTRGAMGAGRETPGRGLADMEHLRAHVAEGYLHGWLIVNAMRFAGYSDAGLGMFCGGFSRPLDARDAEVVRRALTRYLKRAYSLA